MLLFPLFQAMPSSRPAPAPAHRYTSGLATFRRSLNPVTSSSISCHETATIGFPASEWAAMTPRCLSAVERK